jgi:hypothetical protein
MFLEWIVKGKPSILGAASGAVAGRGFAFWELTGPASYRALGDCDGLQGSPPRSTA